MTFFFPARDVLEKKAGVWQVPVAVPAARCCLPRALIVHLTFWCGELMEVPKRSKEVWLWSRCTVTSSFNAAARGEGHL